MKEKFDPTFLILLIVFAIAFGSMFYFFTFKKDTTEEDKVVAFENESDYPVYSGKNVNEYWRSTLSEKEKLLYDEFKESYLQFKKQFATQVQDEITTDEMTDTYNALFNDHPEMFWMNSYSATTFNKKVVKNKVIYLYYYYDVDEAKKLKEEMEPKISQIVNEASKKETDFEKIMYLHDTIIKSAKYEKNEETNTKKYQTIVSILTEEKTVCAGYTYLFKLCCDRLGIEAISLRDISNKNGVGNHTWNMVKLYGKWYGVDLTWDDDDAVTNKGEIKYRYFLKNKEDFYKNHKMQKGMPEMES